MKRKNPPMLYCADCDKTFLDGTEARAEHEGHNTVPIRNMVGKR